MKIHVCHIPPGNPGNAHTIEIDDNALSAHLAHGDTEGACPVPETPPTTDTTIPGRPTPPTTIETTPTTIPTEPTTPPAPEPIQEAPHVVCEDGTGHTFKQAPGPCPEPITTSSTVLVKPSSEVKTLPETGGDWSLAFWAFVLIVAGVLVWTTARLR